MFTVRTAFVIVSLAIVSAFIVLTGGALVFATGLTSLAMSTVFLSAALKGKKKKKEQIYEEIERLKNKKKISQPSRVKTGGSTFKNPINSSKLKVWELIKNSVPAGSEFGDATISHQHFNFLVNKKDAKFNDMIKLINFIKKKVFEKYKIKLNLEIVIAD